MQNTNIKEVFPLWWHFDGGHGILYCEIEKNGKLEFIREIARLTPSEQYEEAWMANTSQRRFVLWKDHEIVSANEIVGEVVDWTIQGNKKGEEDKAWTNSLYLAIRSRLYWVRDPEQPFSIELDGKHFGGGRFVDELRVFIPLENDRFVAISERNRWYYLIGKPADWTTFEKKEAGLKKAEEKAKANAEKDAKREKRRAVASIRIAALKEALSSKLSCKERTGAT